MTERVPLLGSHQWTEEPDYQEGRKVTLTGGTFQQNIILPQLEPLNFAGSPSNDHATGSGEWLI